MKYNFISSDSLASYIEAVNSNKLKNSLGIAFFRLGYLNEPLVLDAKRIRRAITKKSKSFLKVEIKYYQLNEQEFYLSLSNLGDPTFFTGEGLRLTLNSDSILGNSSDFDRFEALDEEKSVLIEDYFDVNETIFSPRLNNNKQTIELKIHLLDGQMKTFKLDLNKVKNQGLLLTM